MEVKWVEGNIVSTRLLKWGLNWCIWINTHICLWVFLDFRPSLCNYDLFILLPCPYLVSTIIILLSWISMRNAVFTGDKWCLSRMQPPDKNAYIERVGWLFHMHRPSHVLMRWRYSCPTPSHRNSSHWCRWNAGLVVALTGLGLVWDRGHIMRPNPLGTYYNLGSLQESHYQVLWGFHPTCPVGMNLQCLGMTNW